MELFCKNINIQLLTLFAKKPHHKSFKGMHNTVTVQTDDGNQKLRKHYLVMLLQEGHQLLCQFYQTEGDGNIISFSKFCSVHPKNLLLTTDNPQYQNKCMIHENFFLKLEVLGHSYGRYESHISFRKYHPTYLLVAYLPHSVWCIYTCNLP